MPARLSPCSFVGAVPPRSAGRAAAISYDHYAAQGGREVAPRDTAHLYQRAS